ncbi:hypothetical protein CK203_013035 [Vitis vinifera]|uniref:Uncharacterized protein n=1 Tax=Vitis vinifera TaxID=29760 RepID=A0A438JLL6_VITVI|nr:hypothetical protein CK203_013035 [Vitis vinifera]
MTTLHGSTLPLRRRAEGCVPLEGMIASAKGSFKVHPYPFRVTLTFWDSVFPLLVSSESAPRSVRVWCGFAILGQSRGDISSLFREIRHRSAGCHSWLVHRRHGFYSVEGILVRLSERSDMDQRVVTLISSRPPWLLFRRPWPCIRQLRVSDSSSTWDDLDSIPVVSLPAKFRMPDIESTVVDVSRRELEGFRQRSDESISSFISRWWGKIAEIVD